MDKVVLKNKMKKNKMKKLVLLSAALFLFGSCATILRGGKTNEIVRISGTPKDANVYVNNELVGKSPLNYEVKKRKEYTVRIEKEGYKDSNALIETKFNYLWSGISLVGNILTMEVGTLVDYKTGAVMDIKTNKINFNLVIDSTTINPAVDNKNSKNSSITKSNTQISENEKIISPAVRIRTMSKEFILKYRAAVTVKTKGGLRVASNIIAITPSYMTLEKNNTKIYYTDIVKIKMFPSRRWIYATLLGAIPWAINAKTAKTITSNCNKKIVEIKVVNHFDRVEYGKTKCN